MKKFIIKSLFLLLPLFIWSLVIIVIDPFNYLNYSELIDNERKKANADKLNQLLYRTVDFINAPSSHLLIGDSRTKALPSELILEKTGIYYKKLNTNAAKLNEIIELVYLANETKKLEHVVIGINFSMFNEFGYDNRVESLKSILDNPLLYIFNIDVAEVIFHIIKAELTGKNIDTSPPMSKEEFWRWTIEEKSYHWYGKYKYPEKLERDLISLDQFAYENDIRLTFIVTPHFKGFRDKIIKYELIDEEIYFKNLIRSFRADVIDFDFDNSITENPDNFTDPIHYSHEVGEIIVNEIWDENYKIGIKY